jgi:dTDP-glucose 4,6-dehydratase
MRKVLVTGGAGFIGSEFVRQISMDSSVKEIWVLDKLTYAGDLNRIKNELSQNKVNLIEADLLDSDKYIDVLSTVDTLVHFAAESHVDRSIKNGFPFIESNVLGTFTLLEAARSNPALQIIHVSTDEVYGSITDGESLETDALRPSSSYSSSKASSDLIALAQRHTFDQRITVTRCCNNYGPWQDKEKVIPTFILNAIQGNSMPIYGNGMNIREWIHVSDHVKAILHLIRIGFDAEIVNLGTAERLTNLELAGAIAEELGLDGNFLNYVDDRPGHDFRYALNSEKIRDSGWNPTKTIQTGLAETVKWYKENANYFLESTW